MNYMKVAFATLLMAACLLAGCAMENARPSGGATEYRQVSAQEAHDLMESEDAYIILDVRTEEEFAEGHIPGAILIPHDAIADQAEATLANKDQLILVYCRSGNRSRQAAEALAELGYTNVVEFGGINDWPYEIEQ